MNNPRQLLILRFNLGRFAHTLQFVGTEEARICLDCQTLAVESTLCAELARRSCSFGKMPVRRSGAKSHQPASSHPCALSTPQVPLRCRRGAGKAFRPHREPADLRAGHHRPPQVAAAPRAIFEQLPRPRLTKSASHSCVCSHVTPRFTPSIAEPASRCSTSNQLRLSSAFRRREELREGRERAR